MRNIILALCVLLLCASSSAASTEKEKKHPPSYRGWSYLVSKLKTDGIDNNTIRQVYLSKRMPRFAGASFAVAPKESHRIYTSFFAERRISVARTNLRKYFASFDGAEKKYGVPKEVMAAIILIETQFGRQTGKSLVINRLSRLVALASPENIQSNYKRLKRTEPKVTLKQVADRAAYLEKTFYPEVLALFELCKMNKINIFNVKGSRAGAFGIPQFLPGSYLKYGVDGNKDGKISLFNMTDAIHSVGNFLKGSGWKKELPADAQGKIIWHYNRSAAYVNAVLEVARRLRKGQDKGR